MPLAGPVVRYVKCRYDRLVARAADVLMAKGLALDPYYDLKGYGIMCGELRSITFERAGVLLLQWAQDGKTLQQIRERAQRAMGPEADA